MSIPLGPSTTVVIARWSSQLLGIGAIAQLFQAIIAPDALANMFGLPLSSSPPKSSKAVYPADYNVRRSTGSSSSPETLAVRREKQWITVYTSRNAILGMLILTFGYGQNNWKAVGTVFRCTVLAGVTDMAVAGWQEGQVGKWAFHAAGTATVAVIGYLLG
jgi:hypothetical protein